LKVFQQLGIWINAIKINLINPEKTTSTTLQKPASSFDADAEKVKIGNVMTDNYHQLIINDPSPKECGNGTSPDGNFHIYRHQTPPPSAVPRST
jgi:hypothetical protein